jgi:RNA polymerase sigma-70 factor (ECF subfamily)
LYTDAFRLAVAMLRRREDAEDAVQEALMKAWRRYDTFHTGTNLRAWFLTIVANQCRSHRRTRWWSVIVVSNAEELRDEHAGSSEDAASIFDLRRELQALPEKQRLLLVCRYYLDLSFDDIATMVGDSPVAVKSATFRALRRLRVAATDAEIVLE